MKTITKYSRLNRKKKTPSEHKLWNKLIEKKIRFRSQRPIDFYIVDFLVPDRMLVVEVDGSSHIGKEEYDLKRQKYIENKGYIFLRFSNEEVLNTDCGYICEKITSYPIVDNSSKSYSEIYGKAKY